MEDVTGLALVALNRATRGSIQWRADDTGYYVSLPRAFGESALPVIQAAAREAGLDPQRILFPELHGGKYSPVMPATLMLPKDFGENSEFIDKLEEKRAELTEARRSTANLTTGWSK